MTFVPSHNPSSAAYEAEAHGSLGIRHVAVLIPARDEEGLVARCLRSVQEARCAVPAHITTDVIVVVDSTTDRTAEVAEHVLAGTGLVERTSVGRVGAARALAAKRALERSGDELAACWLANTDADCIVPPDWLLHQLSLAKAGGTAVAGIVDVDNFEEHGPLVPELFRSTYLIHPDGTHPHVHGANLGVRADAYVRAGGWADQANAEDHDLWRRLHLKREACRSVASLKVLTSGRRTGRAPNGFADALAAHNGATA